MLRTDGARAIGSAPVIAQSATPRPKVRPGAREFSGAYLSTLAVSALACVAAFWLGLQGLASIGLLPPPQISNNLCIDDKLSFLRSHPLEQPRVLAVGSSITWRTFDGSAVVEATHGGGRPLNGGFCGLHMNQTYFTLKFFLRQFPSVRDILVIVAPLDMTGCASTSTQVFDPDDARGFAYRGQSAFTFYLKYFDPLTLAKNVLILRKVLTGTVPLDDLSFDRFGAGPLDTDGSGPGLVYGVLPPFDPACFRALRAMAEDVAAQGRRLVVVTMPVNPVWKHEYDRDGAVLGQMTKELRETLSGTRTVFWDANDEWPIRSGAYLDAMHVRWSMAKVFSRAIVSHTALGGDSR